MRPLEELESVIAKELGMLSGNIDSVAVFHKVKALHLGRKLVSNLRILHRLRIQCNRIQGKLPVQPNVHSHLPGPPYRVDGSRFYAVIIGVSEYVSYASYPLQGCISDVRLMEQYLTENLGVPRNRIQMLLGSEEHISVGCSVYPSRTNIVDMLLSIIDNCEILYGDNIIIYYSGHGSCYPFEEKGIEIETGAETEKADSTEYIEALCPIDRDTIGDDGKAVPDISDRELNTILKQISRAKGHHITVILDCCHSGGVSRGLPEPESRTSSPTKLATVQDMLLAGDEKLRGYPSYRSILSKDWCPDMHSHVVLAACKDYQFAKAKKVKTEDEMEGYIGIFTHSLVHALRSGCYTKETKYTDLVHCLDQTPSQTPVVAGEYRSARIWYQE